MSVPVIGSNPPYRILVVDDEPDIHAVTKLSLRGLKHRDRPVTFLNAASGSECVRVMRENPDVAVILLDVVMESEHAGLDACRTIRGELDNPFVRILLRTGQPGSAPERQTIDDYDIDDYLSKTETSANKLYTSVRTALKAWDQLVQLDRHRRLLDQIHACAVNLHAFDALEDSLGRVLDTAVAVCPASLAVLHLETFNRNGDPQRMTLHVSTDDGPHQTAAAQGVVTQVARHGKAHSAKAPLAVGDGWVVPLVLHRELGFGWIFLRVGEIDPLALQVLSMLSAHAANALYAAVAQQMLEARDGSVFDEMSI